MASQLVSENECLIRKRGRDDEYWNSDAAAAAAESVMQPEAKRTNCGLLQTEAHDTDHLMALLERIENINPEETSEINETLEIQQEERLCGVIKSLEEEIGLNQSDICSSNAYTIVNEGHDENIKVHEHVAASNSSSDKDWSEATSVSDVGDLSSGHYDYEDIRAQFGFFVDAADELGIMAGNHCSTCVDGDSMGNIYSCQDDVDHIADYSAEANNSELFYGSLWEDDIWQVNYDANQIALTDHQSLVSAGTDQTFREVGNDVRTM